MGQGLLKNLVSTVLTWPELPKITLTIRLVGTASLIRCCAMLALTTQTHKGNENPKVNVPCDLGDLHVKKLPGRSVKKRILAWAITMKKIRLHWLPLERALPLT